MHERDAARRLHRSIVGTGNAEVSDDIYDVWMIVLLQPCDVLAILRRFSRTMKPVAISNDQATLSIVFLSSLFLKLGSGKHLKAA